MTKTRARQQEGAGEEPSHSPASPVLALLGVLALVVCCALPFLLIAAGELSLSLLLGGDRLLVTVEAIVAVVLFGVIGAAVHSRNRNKSRQQTNPDGDACCQ